MNQSKPNDPHLEPNDPQLEPNDPQLEPNDPQLEPNDPQLESKHKIFLSHSGAQKNFTEHLFNALKNAHHSPFFDRDDASLRAGQKWHPMLMKAANQCSVAVLVLSDEFFSKSEWPMRELNAFVTAKNNSLYVLPLFLEIAWEEFNEEERQRKWIKAWKDMKVDDATIGKWKDALSAIKEHTSLKYGGKNEGEPAFIKKVVEAVCKLVNPDVKFDVPYNQGMEEMCSPILQKFKEIAPSSTYKVRVMGVYGMGGAGKTTISKALCNKKFEDFAGKVCHVELGSKSVVETLKTVLQELTDADSTLLDNQHDKLLDLLKKRIKEKKVFLVLDNVWDHQIEEVQRYLKAWLDNELDNGSMVLVTSRSQDILVKQLHIRECDCFELPQLEENGAIDVLFYYIGSMKPNREKDYDIVKRFVHRCRILQRNKLKSRYGEKSTYHYLPLVLKVLGSQLQIISSEMWELERHLETYLEKLEVVKFNLLREKKHPIFSILRLGYDALCLEDQHIFLDLALIWAPKQRSLRFEWCSMWEWMSTIHRKTENDMRESVNALERNGLLDRVVDVDGLQSYDIHDLYIDFAEAETRAGPLKRRHFLLDKDGTDIPFELLKNPSGRCWPSLERIAIYNSKVQSLKRAKLKRCSNVEVLHLYGCEELVEVDLSGLENLRSMEVVGCRRFGQSSHEIEKLSNLVLFHFAQSRGAVALEFLESLCSLTALKVLKLEDCKGIKDLPCLSQLISLEVLIVRQTSISRLPDCGLLKKLTTINVANCENLTSLAGIGGAQALRKLDASRCDKLMELPGDFSGLEHLEEINVRCCWSLESLGGIGGARALRKLDASRCEKLKELPGDFSGSKHLEEVNVSDCWSLENLGGIGGARALRKLDASRCAKLMELPGDFSGSEHLEEVNVSGCRRLESLGGIGGVQALRKLDASYCVTLKELPGDFSGLEHLEEVNVRCCWSLESLGGIGGARALRKLDASRCLKLKELPGDFSGSEHLEEVNVSDCRRLESLGGIGGVRALRKLDASILCDVERAAGRFQWLGALGGS